MIEVEFEEDITRALLCGSVLSGDFAIDAEGSRQHMRRHDGIGRQALHVGVVVRRNIYVGNPCKGPMSRQSIMEIHLRRFPWLEV